MLYLIAYLLFASLAGFAMCAADKRRAEKRMHRIPERSFFLLAAAGGAFGVLIGMLFFRHKTRHRSFTIGIPAILLVHIAIIILLVYFYQQNMGGIFHGI